MHEHLEQHRTLAPTQALDFLTAGLSGRWHVTTRAGLHCDCNSYGN
jgi:hypothetical protein